jgi:hypothetical protein
LITEFGKIAYVSQAFVSVGEASLLIYSNASMYIKSTSNGFHTGLIVFFSTSKSNATDDTEKD